MEHFRVLISRYVKQLRNAEYQRQKCGSETREENLSKEKEKKEDKLDLLRIALKENLQASIRELAKITGLSKSVVQNLKGELYVSQGFHYKESELIRVLTSEPYTKIPPYSQEK
jgi:hypothetical protein